MVLHIQVVEGEYRLVLPPEMVEELKLRDGDALEVLPVPAARAGDRFVTLEEGMTAFHKFEALHRNTMRELARS